MNAPLYRSPWVFTIGGLMDALAACPHPELSFRQTPTSTWMGTLPVAGEQTERWVWDGLDLRRVTVTPSIHVVSWGIPANLAENIDAQRGARIREDREALDALDAAKLLVKDEETRRVLDAKAQQVRNRGFEPLATYKVAAGGDRPRALLAELRKTWTDRDMPMAGPHIVREILMPTNAATMSGRPVPDDTSLVFAPDGLTFTTSQPQTAMVLF